VIILIPSFEPTFRLLDVIAGIRGAVPWLTVLVVDDGSGVAYAPVFEAARSAGARVLSYPDNRGKGHALKTGFHYAQTRWPGEALVTADSDGQHSTADIIRVADLTRDSDAIVLGGRRFTGEVPVRSRAGNAITRRLFRAASGLAVHDTQTGLRGFPAATIGWLTTVKGDRFEYELNVLLEATSAGLVVREIEIETIYLDENASSHFRPIIDSARIMAPMLKYAASSLTAFVLDLVLLQLFFAATGSLLTSVIAARVISATVNFVVNRQLVFGSREPGHLKRHVIGYFGLAIALLGASYGLLAVLTAAGLPLLAAKLTTDVTLYLASFAVQRRLVFAAPARALQRAGTGSKFVVLPAR
jgi:putative flippase GtrA